MTPPGPRARGHRSARLRPRRRRAEPVPPPQERDRPGLRGAPVAPPAVRHREHEPAVLRRDTARRRGADPGPQLVAADHLPPGGQRPRPAPAAVAVRSGRRHADRRGRGAFGVPGPAGQAAARGGHRRGPGRAGGRRGDGRQPGRLGRAGGPPHRRPRQAAAVPRGRAAERPGRQGAAPRAHDTASAPTRHCELIGSSQGLFSVRAARRRARNCSRQRGRSCRTRSSARTTRWPSGCSGRSPQPGCGCPSRSRWSASTTSSPPACATRRSRPFTSRCGCWASKRAPGFWTASPGRA